MKNIIRRSLPYFVIKYYDKWRNYRSKSKFRNKKPEEVFKQIYENHHWKSKETISGLGSELVQTRIIINELNKLLKEFEIKSVLDVPCGDFNWMKEVDLTGIKYIGADIVSELINSNNRKYERDNINFKVINLINDFLPESDLILTRDCFVHLCYEDIYNSIKNIKSSNCKYLLTTTFTERSINYDIITGDWRPLNLQKRPFNFQNHILMINENCTEGEGKFTDKSLGLWRIADLKLPDI